jgi:hypothetical protein
MGFAVSLVFGTNLFSILHAEAVLNPFNFIWMILCPQATIGIVAGLAVRKQNSFVFSAHIVLGDRLTYSAFFTDFGSVLHHSP